MPRWTHDSDDAAELARAILAGTVTEDIKTFKDFFDPTQNGPGAAIGEKFNYHTIKGERNLKLNWKKLTRKIKIWNSNKDDPDTGKRKCCM